MVHVYDSCANTWTKVTDMSPASATHSASVVKGEIYIGGGVPVMNRGKPVYQIFRKYNPATGVTTPLGDMPFKSYHSRSVTVGNMIYFLAGCGLNGTTTQYCSDRHKKFVVYNTGATDLSTDESISACYCLPSCGQGKYFCFSDNTCKLANQSCGTLTCNNNGMCDRGESCNCADCNSEADHCGLVG